MDDGRKRAERSAFDSGIPEVLAPLYDFARTLAAPAEAEDLVQTACLRAFENRDRFAPGSRLKAWIFTILKHEFVSRHRRVRRHGELAIEVATPLHRDGVAADLEASLIEAQWHAEVRAALLALPDPYRAPVYLRDVGDFTYAEIAAIESCPLGTVMSRLARGRALLRGALAKLAHERGLSDASRLRRATR